MANCRQVYDFLSQVSSRAVTTPLGDADANRLGALGYVRFVSPDEYRQMTTAVGTIATDQAAIAQETAERGALASEVGRDTARTHSILFHLHGQETEQSELDQAAQAQARLQAMDTELEQREAAFNQLLTERSLLDTLTPCGSGYVGLTTAGTAALRDLTVRLYRYGDADFEAYAAEMQRVDQELVAEATGGAAYVAQLAPQLTDADLAYLWAISVGLAKAQPDAAVGGPRFAQAYESTKPLSTNAENRLMASEILVAIPQPPPDTPDSLRQLVRDVQGLGVPREAALGVAATVLFGRRADGTFAIDPLRQFLQLTNCYEAAALLAIVNTPADALTAKFQQLRALFSGWGYSYSEDTELASAYLAVSENAPDQIGLKLAILARGLSSYLQYPVVAAAILASVATLEANEMLNLVERAYAVIGARARGLSQAELICVAVRMVHGLRDELVGELDATAKAAPAAVGARGVGYMPRPVFLPIIVVHNAYFATYGGITGVHPAHVHGMPTGFGGAGVG